MDINIHNLTKAELQAVIRACNIIQNKGAETFLSDTQITQIKNRIQELSMCEDCELTKYIKKVKETK